MTTVMKYTTKIQPMSSTNDPAGCDFVFMTGATGAATPTAATDVSAALTKFYITANPGQSLALDQYMGRSLNASLGLSWEAYNITTHLDGSPHGAPINSGTISGLTTSIATGAVPEGVAAAISYRGDYGTDVEFVRDPVTHKVTQRPRARHRGRIYFGPIGSNAIQNESVTQRCIFSNTFMSDCLVALQAISEITDSASNQWKFVHWSKKNASVELLVQCTMDDRPDYQRRRSDASTIRTGNNYHYA